MLSKRFVAIPPLRPKAEPASLDVKARRPTIKNDLLPVRILGGGDDLFIHHIGETDTGWFIKQVKYGRSGLFTQVLQVSSGFLLG